MKKFFSKLLTTLSITAMLFYAMCILIDQEKELNNLSNETDKYEMLIGEEIMKTEKLNETKSRMNTDEYIEEYAREKLGLVMPYEVIFVDASVWCDGKFPVVKKVKLSNGAFYWLFFVFVVKYS